MPKVMCTSKDCRWVLESGWCACPDIEIVEKTTYINNGSHYKHRDCKQHEKTIDFVTFMEERGLD